MTDRYLKARIPADLYEDLMVRASAQGQRLGTFVRDALQQHAQKVTTSETLARIEASLATAAAPAQRESAEPDHQTGQLLQEIRLLARELCLQADVRILDRVSAQLRGGV